MQTQVKFILYIYQDRFAIESDINIKLCNKEIYCNFKTCCKTPVFFSTKFHLFQNCTSFSVQIILTIVIPCTTI